MFAQPAIKRLQEKSYLQGLVHHLNHNYDLSLVEAETLGNEILRERMDDSPSFLADGQLWYTAISCEEPAGKALAKCKKVRVKLTVHSPADLGVSEPDRRREMLVHRLSWEATEQGAALTIEDLARILITSEKTVRRIIKDYQAQGVFIPTRGHLKDIGPGTTHKSQAVRLFLKGLTVTEIAQRLAHHINSIERYLDDFCIVMMGIKDGYSVERIARNTRLSERLTREYVAIHQEFSGHPDYQWSFERLSERLSYLLKKRALGEDGGSP